MKFMLIVCFISISFVSFVHGKQVAASSNSKTKTADEMLYIAEDNSKCEVCRVVTNKLQTAFAKTDKPHAFIEKGYNFEIRDSSPRIGYRKSQLRLIESTERVCTELYFIHFDYEKRLNDSKRMHRHDDIQQLKSICESLLEKYEDRIEKWFWKFEDTVTLQDYLCRKVVLKGESQKCLDRAVEDEIVNEKDNETKKKRIK